MFPHPHIRVVLGAMLALLALLTSVPAQAVGPDPAVSAPSPEPRRAGCASGDVWSHLAECGWPAASNTGPRARTCPGDRLRTRGTDPTDVIRITRRNTNLSCLRITGCLVIEAPGVRLRDLAIRCTSGRQGESANGTAVVDVRPGGSATLTRVATNGLNGVHACVWHQGSRLRVTALDCTGVNDGIFSWSDIGRRGQGDDFVIRESYFHGFTHRTANGHVDGYQTEGAERGRIIHNTWLMTTDDGDSANAAIGIWNGRRDARDILVARNLIAGGGFSVYAQDYSPSEGNPSGGYSVTDVRFVDNVFSRRLHGCVGSYGVWFPRGRPTDGWDRDGNHVLETGSDIDTRNPSFQGRACV